MKFSLYALIALTQTAKVVSSAAADGFTSIAGDDYGSVESVNINLRCPTNQNIQLPNLVFTITPGDAASVSSSPPNVVYTAVKDGVLSFTGYNPEAAGKSGGGVQITLPADSLKKVTIDGSNAAQVRNGFTSLEHIQASGKSYLRVTATTSSTSEVNLDVDGSSTVVELVSNVNLVTTTGITGQSIVRVKTPLFKDVNVGKQALLSIDGGIDGGTVQGSSTVTVSGDISGAVSARDRSTINAGDISGTVSAGDRSSISTSTCAKVVTTGLATCDDEGDAPSVSVGFVPSDDNRMASGSISCGSSLGTSTTDDGGTSTIVDDTDSSLGTSTTDDSSGSSPTVAIVTASLVAAAVVVQAM